MKYSTITQEKEKNDFFCITPKHTSWVYWVGFNREHLYAYFQALSSDVSLLLVSVAESSNSALQVLLLGENRLELRLCKKPFFPKPFLLSCSVFMWNSLRSSSVKGRQFSSFSGYSCHPIAFSNLCSASSEWETTSPSSSTGRARPFWWQPPSHFTLVQVCYRPLNLSTSHTLCPLRSPHSGHPSESSGARFSCQ